MSLDNTRLLQSFVNSDPGGLKLQNLTSWTFEQIAFDQSGRVIRTITRPRLVETFTLKQVETIEQALNARKAFATTITIYHQKLHVKKAISTLVQAISPSVWECFYVIGDAEGFPKKMSETEEIGQDDLMITIDKKMPVSLEKPDER